jgi:putative transcriptional regulator
MTDPALEPRSFESEVPEAEADAFDPITSSVLIHRVRWHTGLSQAEFASVFRIDPDYLRDLESGLARPDSALVAYLMVIDRAPEFVRAALATC